MLLVVMILGATMLGITTIAGYISIQKIKASTDIVDSTKAIYAADSGIEWYLYKTFSLIPGAADAPKPEFENGATVEVREVGNTVRSTGHAQRAFRAFGIFMGLIDL